MAILDAFSQFFGGDRAAAVALLDTPAPEPTRAKTSLQPTRAQKLAFDGAKRNRTNYDWTAGQTGANTELYGALSTLRARCSDLARNNPYALKAIDTVASNVISTGIRARWENAAVQALWDDWIEQTAVDSDLDFYGQQTLAVRGWLERGDVVARRRWRRLEDGLAVPMQIELLEGDFIDHLQNGASRSGGSIVQGVEFDAIGRRSGYWLFRQHPGESSVGAGLLQAGPVSAFVPASDVAHLYRALRPGQVRGVPMLGAVIEALRNLGTYEAAERIRKRSQAGIIGAITPADDAVYDEETTDNTGVYATDSDGNIVDDTEPGQWVILRNGKSATFSQPSSDAGYTDFVRTSLRGIGAGCLVTYEQLSMDLSQVNYSSIRLGLVDFQRLVKVLQTQVVIPLFCRRVAQWFLEAADAAGKLPAGKHKPKWILPEREEIDRLTAIDAAIKAIRAGLASRHDQVAANGGDADEVLAEIAADLAALDGLGITLDTDPRHPATGPLQQAATP